MHTNKILKYIKMKKDGCIYCVLKSILLKMQKQGNVVLKYNLVKKYNWIKNNISKFLPEVKNRIKFNAVYSMVGRLNLKFPMELALFWLQECELFKN